MPETPRIVALLIVAIALAAFLAACDTKKPLLIASADLVKPATPLLQYAPPIKQGLNHFEWDFPRTDKMEQVKNSADCIKIAKEKKLDRAAIYPTGTLPVKCSVPAIDNGSNLYIGLTEADYRTLVGNYVQLLTREKRWLLLLDEINKQFRVMHGAVDKPKEKQTETTQ